MNPVLKQYAFWQIEDESGYWMIYDSLAEVLNEAPEEEDIYTLNAKLVGRKRATVVKIAKSKKKVKK